MKRREYRAELGVRKLERYIETPDFKGRRDVIETVAEYTGTWENAPIVYRYAVHWLFNYDTMDFEDYDKFPANDEAARYGRISIPRDLWQKMENMVFSFLYTEEVRHTLTDTICLRPQADRQKVIVTFKKKQWSGFSLVYSRGKDGEVVLLESRVSILVRHARAQRGHSRIPRALCELTHDLVTRYFTGLPIQNGRQQSLDLSNTLV